jgi:cytidylate kinase
MIVTISGNPGSGKSTVAKLLVKECGYERIYAGEIFREIARERGITSEELVRRAEKDQKIDILVDERVRDKVRELERAGKNILVEGRIQFHFLPESIKIYVYVDEKEGARRIWKDLQDKEAALQRNQEAANSIDEVVEKNRFREETDAQRYMKLYGVDHRDKKHYDFVVDTTKITPQQAADKIIEYINKKKPIMHKK